MSALQVEALQYVKYIPEMPDDKLRVLIDTFQSLITPTDKSQGNYATSEKKPRRLGSLQGMNLISEGYDIDECNDEVAKMFGVTGQ